MQVKPTKWAVLFRLVAQAELHLHLIMLDLAVGDVAADAHDLDPFDIAQRFRCRGDAVLNRLVDAFSRAADDFRDAIDVIAHRCLRPVSR